MKQDRDDEAIVVLSRLRRLAPDDQLLLAEYVEIRAEVVIEQQFVRDNYPNVSGVRLEALQVWVSSYFEEFFANFGRSTGRCSPTNQALDGLRLDVV